MRKKTITHYLGVFSLMLYFTMAYCYSIKATPPENMDFSVLKTESPQDSFELTEGMYKAAISSGLWNVVTLNTYASMKWTAPYKNDSFSISPTKFSAAGEYCSYLISPALDLNKVAGKTLSFMFTATSKKGDSKLDVLLINNQGETLIKLASIDKTSANSQTFIPENIVIPQNKGIGFIAFVARGTLKTSFVQLKLKDIALKSTSQIPNIRFSPSEGLSFDVIAAGETSVQKSVQVYIANFKSGVPSVSIKGINSEDFRIHNPNALSVAGGELMVTFEPKGGGNKKAFIEVIAGSARAEIPLQGTATGATPKIKISATPATITFPETGVGEKANPIPLNIDIQNATELPTITINGQNKADYSLSNLSKLTIKGGGVVVHFTPSAAGSRKAVIAIDVQGTHIEVPLSGNGKGNNNPIQKEDFELLEDQFFYEFDNSGKPIKWETSGIAKKIEKGFNGNTGFAVELDARNSNSEASISQKVNLANSKYPVTAGTVLEGMVHFKSMEPKIEKGAFRLACQWLDSNGNVLPSTEDAFMNNSFFFDKHKAWDEIRFRTIAPEGASYFSFKVVVAAGALVHVDDFSLLQLTPSNAKMQFISVLQHINNIHASLGTNQQGTLLVQTMNLMGNRTPVINAKGGTLTLSPSALPQGTAVNTINYTYVPSKKGNYYNGARVMYNDDDPIALSTFNIDIIDPANPPLIKAEETTLPTAEKFTTLVNTRSEQLINFIATGLIGSVTVSIEQDEAGIFLLSTSQLFYSESKDKLLNSNVKLTFAPRSEKQYNATLVLTSPRMAPVRIPIVGKGFVQKGDWQETFASSQPASKKDARFTGAAWNSYYFLDKGYYKLQNATWIEKGALTLEPNGVLECDEFFNDGIISLNVTLKGKPANDGVSIEYTTNGGGSFKQAKATAEGYLINTHRPTRFRVVNKGNVELTLQQITAKVASKEQRINYPKLTNEAITLLGGTPLVQLNEDFNSMRHTRGINLEGWQNFASVADRPFFGWAQKNKTNGKVEEVCAQISFFNSLNKDDEREQEAWLITPTLSYKKAANKILTFRLRYELPTENGKEQFGVYIITKKGEQPNLTFIDLTKHTMVKELKEDRWHDYYIDLSTIKELEIEDLFHVAFTMYSPKGGKYTSLTFMVDDVTFGNPVLPTVEVDKEQIAFLFKNGLKQEPQPIHVFVQNGQFPPSTILVPSHLAETFPIDDSDLTKDGGVVTVAYKTKEHKQHAAALIISARRGNSKMVRILATEKLAAQTITRKGVFEVFPTRSSTEINFSLPVATFALFDMNGNKLEEGRNAETLNISYLASGNYILVVTLPSDDALYTTQITRL